MHFELGGYVSGFDEQAAYCPGGVIPVVVAMLFG